MKERSQLVRVIAILTVVLALLMPVNYISADNSPLRFTAREGKVTIRFDIKNVNHAIQYSYDGANWNMYESNSELEIETNQSVCFRAENNQTSASAFGEFFERHSSRFYFSSIDGYVLSSGNIMSLYGPDCPDLPLPEYAFAHMFSDCRALKSAPALPSTILGPDCYSSMFENCTSLTMAPALSSGILADHCYFKMFSGCSSLKIAPTLPATVLAENCYRLMFENCTSLENAPALCSVNLAEGCYSYMFMGCCSLKTVPELPAASLSEMCYFHMFDSCKSLEVNTSGLGDPWKISTSSIAADALTDMFNGTSGTMNGTPSVNTTYYIVSKVH